MWFGLKKTNLASLVAGLCVCVAGRVRVCQHVNCQPPLLLLTRDVRHSNGASSGATAVALFDAIAVATAAALGVAGSEWSSRPDRQLQPDGESVEMSNKLGQKGFDPIKLSMSSQAQVIETELLIF